MTGDTVGSTPRKRGEVHGGKRPTGPNAPPMRCLANSCAMHARPELTTNAARSESARDNRAHNIQGHAVAIRQGAPDVKKTGHHHTTPKVHGVHVDTCEGSNPSPLATSSIQTPYNMRKITYQAVQAFQGSRPFKSGNTQVRVIRQDGGGSLVLLELHGNTIARHESWNGRTFVTNAGWDTRTTKERLNGIDGVSISQRRGVWYLNGNEWDGSWICPQTGKKPTT